MATETTLRLRKGFLNLHEYKGLWQGILGEKLISHDNGRDEFQNDAHGADVSVPALGKKVQQLLSLLRGAEIFVISRRMAIIYNGLDRKNYSTIETSVLFLLPLRKHRLINGCVSRKRSEGVLVCGDGSAEIGDRISSYNVKVVGVRVISHPDATLESFKETVNKDILYELMLP
ncbi:hypothetical protein CAPTEDRAFT_192240 [Capitella teleta]|uniref:Uncharacterized protein n=1 Tax=Capitella teleta TaxID=283909 RepID=R7UEJ5_CAPTE|nr:hypothetical protein CAPTEDRAFT_192240 [Capitella teleta]|eukprot:ELU04501.1 hypothetical protein CAPTEDRAFT_192240 [Capitella teleta]